eukprot:snap_masked-scaffold_55-processed-gene-0.42-mRNA-1 protein AED:1.00 eAED:1.00 QI:0/0/0/0/1/1/2/0/70
MSKKSAPASASIQLMIQLFSGLNVDDLTLIQLILMLQLLYILRASATIYARMIGQNGNFCFSGLTVNLPR